MSTSLRVMLASLALALTLAAAPGAQAAGVACYHCECAKCIVYLGGYNCDYVLENTACDCLLGGWCNYNPTYCSQCSSYPWNRSCRLMSCGAAGQEACVGAQDLQGIQVIQEDDATS